MCDTIPDLLKDAARRFGSREFLRFPEQSLTFTEVDERTDRLVHALVERGIQPGDRVAVMMDNVPGWPLSWLAVLKAGAVTVPVNARYLASDLSHVLRDSGAVAVLTSADYAPLVREVGGQAWLLEELTSAGSGPIASWLPGDIANFQYTSGTTGFPKACMLSHTFWIKTARDVADAVRLRDDDVMLIAQAFSYMDPQWTMLMCLMGGIPLVVLPRFSASGFWPSVREHGATLTYVLGTMPLLLFKQQPDPLDQAGRIRLVLCSGISTGLHQAFEERWGAPWRELYGSTESGTDLLVAPDDARTVGTGAMGYPPPGKQVRIVDEEGEPVPDGSIGEIVCQGEPMMSGYWNHPEATAQAFRGGWYHTGDLGFRDEDGYIHHAGRLKDMIRRGGENISAAEVESVLAQHPAVLAVALVPIPDELFGELPKAFIQPRPGHAADLHTAIAVINFARDRLARFKIPAFVEFVEHFPMTPSARIEKRHLLQPERDQRAGAIAIERESA